MILIGMPRNTVDAPFTQNNKQRLDADMKSKDKTYFSMRKWVKGPVHYQAQTGREICENQFEDVNGGGNLMGTLASYLTVLVN